jgi:hypothetical protein
MPSVFQVRAPRSDIGWKLSRPQRGVPVTVASGRTLYVFNIQRNRHRLIAAIHFNTQTVYVLQIMTHREYDRSRWEDEL